MWQPQASKQVPRPQTFLYAWWRSSWNAGNFSSKHVCHRQTGATWTTNTL